MLVNFLHPSLNPTVQCSTISSEGYEISNLASSDHHSKGFLGEGFVSGPVTITVKFICPVSLKYVTIWSQVGGQKSLGIELSVVNSRTVTRFASTIIPEDGFGVTFCKEGYKLDHDRYPPDAKSFLVRTFSRNKSYENIVTMQIKIFKYRYVPAIKKIEIWGEPNKQCDAKIRNNIYALWLRSQKSFNVEKPVSARIPEVEIDSSSKDDIPEEFFDVITHELMALPMILPSGKIVDYSSLERFRIEEAKWGRLPSDPFTGLPFTESRKPVVATTLKSKIDSFCLSNPDLNQIKTLPRRLGCERESFSDVNLKISRIICKDDTRKRKLSQESNSTANLLDTNERIVQTASENESLSTLSQKVSQAKDNSSANLAETSGVSTTSDDASLSNVLDKMLSHLPSYLDAPAKVKKKKLSVACYDCFNSVDLYKLLCDHIICKICLIRNRNRCRNCNLTFTFSQVQKVHITESRDVL